MALCKGVEGFAYGLRPVEESDAEFVISLRTDPSLSKFINTTSNDIDGQKRWIKDQRTRPGDYYFVVFDIKYHNLQGLISLYDLDERENTAEWGRWIIKQDSLASIESVLLIYKLAFEVFNLGRVYSRTLTQNTSVVSFHDSLNLDSREVLKQYVQIKGIDHDAVQHTLLRSGYTKVSRRLSKMAMKIASKVV